MAPAAGGLVYEVRCYVKTKRFINDFSIQNDDSAQDVVRQTEAAEEAQADLHSKLNKVLHFIPLLLHLTPRLLQFYSIFSPIYSQLAAAEGAGEPEEAAGGGVLRGGGGGSGHRLRRGAGEARGVGVREEGGF